MLGKVAISTALFFDEFNGPQWTKRKPKKEQELFYCNTNVKYPTTLNRSPGNIIG